MTANPFSDSQPNTRAVSEARMQEADAKKYTKAEADLRRAAMKKDEASMVAKLSELVKAPQYLLEAFREMAADRAYVYRDCMMTDSQDTVAVNQVLRNQLVAQAYLGVANPQPFCQPTKRVGKATEFELDLFAQTAEIHLENVTRLMRFADKLEGATQDASTNAYSVLKVTLQDDFMKDPAGNHRFGDMQEQVAEYERLKMLKDMGEIQSGSAEEMELADLEKTLRIFAAGKLEEQIKAVPMLVPVQVPVVDPVTGQPQLDPVTFQPVTTTVMQQDPQDPREVQRKAVIDGSAPLDILGMPQVPHYVGFVCDQILPEDFRWDWRVTRPEDWIDGDWLAYRVYMAPEDITAKWKVTTEELAACSTTPKQGGGSAVTTNSTAQDPNLRNDIETQTINDTIAVWVVYHRKMFRRYTFIEGMQRLLDNEVPQAVGQRFYPLFPIYYNRVTGRAMPISDVKLTRNLQDEINMLRTHDREARRASYPVLFIPKGLMDKGAIDLYRNRMPFSVIEVERPEEIKKYLEESTAVPYNPQLYSIDGAQNQLQQMFGIPLVVTGGASGEDLASAIAMSKEGMETGVGQRKVRVNKVISEVYYWILEISLRVYPESYLKKTCGAAALWPRMDADALYTNLRVEVKGGLSGQPHAKERLDLWTNFATIAQSLGLPVNGFEVLKELLDAIGIRVDPQKFMVPMAIPGTAPAGAPGGSPAAPPGGQGPDGGAPLMVDPARGAPDDLSQIPNGPTPSTQA